MANNFEPVGRGSAGRGSNSASRSKPLLLSCCGAWVLGAELLLGMFMLAASMVIENDHSKFLGEVLGALCTGVALLGLFGLAWQFEPFANMHVIGAMVCLTMLFSSRWQAGRNPSIMCALSQLRAQDDILNKIAVEENERREVVFNTMLLRLTAMDLLIDKMEEDPEKGGLNNNTVTTTRPPKSDYKNVQKQYYKEVWRATDNAFVGRKMDELKKFSNKLLEALTSEETAGRVDALNSKLNKEQASKLHAAIDAAFNTATKVIRQSENHLSLPGEFITAEQYKANVEEINVALTTVMEILMAVEEEVKGDDNPLTRNIFTDIMGHENGLHLKDDIKTSMSAISRQREDVYDTMDLPHLQTVKDTWRKKWESALISKVNRSSLGQNSYLDKLPSMCLKEIRRQKGLRLVGLIMILFLALSAFIVFSGGFRMAVARQFTAQYY